MKTGGPKPDKPKLPRAPKQVHINDFQFYPPRLVELQNREFDVHRVTMFSLAWVIADERTITESSELPRADQRTRGRRDTGAGRARAD